MKISFGVKIAGLELVTVKETTGKGKAKEVHEYDRLMVTLKGLGQGSKERVVFPVDVEELPKYRLGTKGEATFEIRQTEMEFDRFDGDAGKGENAETTPPRASRASGRTKH